MHPRGKFRHVRDLWRGGAAWYGASVNRTPTLSQAQRDAIHAGRETRLARARRLGWRKLASYRAQYGLMLVLVGLLRLLPVEAASGLGGWAGRLLLGRRLDTPAVRKTIRVPFPDADEALIAALVRETADNIVRVVAELAHLKTFAREPDRIRIEGAEHVTAARAGGRGVLFVMGHFANWEIAAIPLRRLGLDGAYAVMPPSNPYVFDWLTRLRMGAGFSEQANAGEGVYRIFRKVLREGGGAIVLADQRLHNGIMAPFFAIETVTNVIPARLARTLGISVVPLAVERVAGQTARFTVRFEPPLEFAATGDDAADERVFTARINAFYEREILRAPGQWLWVDPRWEPA